MRKKLISLILAVSIISTGVSVSASSGSLMSIFNTQLLFDNFKSNGYPKDAEEWFELYEKQMKFLEKRNQRIKKKLKNYMK